MTTAKKALDEIEEAHAALGGKGPGRRFATLQVNHAYVMLLSSQFQGYCRELHTEAVEFLVANTSPPSVATVLRLVMTQGRRLDQGNPNPGNLGADFSRLGMDFWTQVNKQDVRNKERQTKLEELNSWRNAIAHQDFGKVGGSPKLRLPAVRSWRSACRALAETFDTAVREHLLGMAGTAPW